MKKELIIKYINSLSKEEIYEYLNKYNIKLNDEEYEFLINIINEKYNDLLDENIYLFKLIRDTINEDAYNKLIDLFNKYKGLIKN